MKFLFFLLIVINCWASPIDRLHKFNQFQNSDPLKSLEQKTFAFDTNSYDFLVGLIILEKNRLGGFTDIGKNLNTIEKLTRFQMQSLERNMYYYLKGLYLLKKKNDIKGSGEFLLKARKFFVSRSDTSGIMHTDFYLLSLNLYKISNFKAEKKLAQFYYDEIIKLGDKSDNELDKVLMNFTILSYHNYLNKTTDENIELNAFKKAKSIIQNNQLLYSFYPGLYINMSAIYLKVGNYKKALEYQLEFLEIEKKTSYVADPYNRILNLINIGYTYAALSRKQDALKAFKKAILELETLEIEPNNIFFMAYEGLSNLYFELKNYPLGWAFRDKKDSISHIINEQKNLEIFSDLQIKYQTEKKEEMILSLKSQKEKTEYINRLILLILIITLFLLSVIILILRTNYKTNRELIRVKNIQDKLFAIVTHDFRGPLSSFQKMADTISFLIKNNRFDDIARISKEIDIKSLQLNNMFNNLIHWCFYQSNNIQVLKQPLKVVPYLSTLVATYDFSHSGLASIALDVQVPSSLKISTDKNMLDIILRNMIENSCKYAEINTPVVISLKSFDENKVELKISNKATLANIQKFNEFKSALDSKNDINWNEANSGLGLILIKEFSFLLGVCIEIHIDTANNSVSFLVIL